MHAFSKSYFYMWGVRLTSPVAAGYLRIEGHSLSWLPEDRRTIACPGYLRIEGQ